MRRVFRAIHLLGRLCFWTAGFAQLGALFALFIHFFPVATHDENGPTIWSASWENIAVWFGVGMVLWFISWLLGLLSLVVFQRLDELDQLRVDPLEELSDALALADYEPPEPQRAEGDPMLTELEAKYGIRPDEPT